MSPISATPAAVTAAIGPTPSDDTGRTCKSSRLTIPTYSRLPVAARSLDGKDLTRRSRVGLMTKRMIARTLATVGLLALALLLTTSVAHAEGDRVAALSTQLTSKHSEKERIAAVAALGRLGDKKALKPLVGALR